MKMGRSVSRIALVMGFLISSSQLLCMSTVGSITNKETAIKEIDKAYKIVFPGDLAIGLGNANNVQREKDIVWKKLFEEMGKYLKKNNDKILTEQFDVIKSLSMEVWNIMLDTYATVAKFIRSDVSMADRKKGLSNYKQIDLVKLYEQKISGMSNTISAMRTKLQVSPSAAQGSDFSSRKITSIRQTLDTLKSKYRASKITSHTRGDAVEAVMYLAHIVNTRQVMKFLSDFEKLKKASISAR